MKISISTDTDETIPEDFRLLQWEESENELKGKVEWNN